MSQRDPYGNADDRFDSLIRFHCQNIGLPFPWLWIKAQVAVESKFKPLAESPVGAKGLLQLMPETDLEIDGDVDAFEIEGNLDNGIRYLLQQYDHLAEIPDKVTRIRCAFAAYNGGRGYVNAALALGRQREGQPKDYNAWRAAGSPFGRWQTWPVIADNLGRVKVNGRRPDWQQMLEYVDRITVKFIEYANELLGGKQ